MKQLDETKESKETEVFFVNKKLKQVYNSNHKKHKAHNVVPLRYAILFQYTGPQVDQEFELNKQIIVELKSAKRIIDVGMTLN